MELEELNKTQIVLLTLLVSFVTSIATGIVTVTLLDQAPPAVTQTINRIVERTVERVVPANPGSPSVITTEKETTIVVKEEDLITESIERNKQYLIRLVKAFDVVVTETESSTDGEDGETTQVQSINENSVLGLGLIISTEGLVVTDRGIVNTLENLKGVAVDGRIFDLEVVSVDDRFPAAILKLIAEDGKTFAGAQFIGGDSLKLGQTVIALGGEERTNVAMGIVSDLAYVDVEILNPEDPEGDVEVRSMLNRIDTTIVSNAIFGSPLLNIFGEVIGISTSESQKSEGSYTPMSVVRTHLSVISDSENSNQEEETNGDE